jgi:hypothetical protein
MIVLLNFPIPVYVAMLGNVQKNAVMSLIKKRQGNRDLEKRLDEALGRRADYEPALNQGFDMDNVRQATWGARWSYLCAFLLWFLGLYLLFNYPY